MFSASISSNICNGLLIFRGVKNSITQCSGFFGHFERSKAKTRNPKKFQKIDGLSIFAGMTKNLEH
jgi:hypothetical protein